MERTKHNTLMNRRDRITRLFSLAIRALEGIKRETDTETALTLEESVWLANEAKKIADVAGEMWIEFEGEMEIKLK